MSTIETPNSSTSAVIATRHEGVLCLAINAPRVRNSLQAPGVLDGLLAQLDVFEQDPGLRVAVLTGSDGAFCSGGDLRQLSELGEDEIRRCMIRNAWLYRRLALSDKLIVAAVDGIAYGAGLGLALACDLVVAGKDAVFCSAFTKVGAMPDAALFWSLPSRVGTAQARRMMLMATEVNAAQALATGLADEHIADGGALPAALALAQRLARGPARPYGRIKAGLRRAPMSLEDALSYQLDNAPGLFASADFKEGSRAFLEKRLPIFGMPEKSR